MSTFQPTRLRPRSQALAALGVASLAAYVAWQDPHSSHALLPRCPTHYLTGLDCPACGGLRMTHDVLHGDLVAAAHDNVVLLAFTPLLMLWVVRCVARRRFSTPELIRRPGVMPAVLALALVWTVVRNPARLPTGPVLRLATHQADLCGWPCSFWNVRPHALALWKTALNTGRKSRWLLVGTPIPRVGMRCATSTG